MNTQVKSLTALMMEVLDRLADGESFDNVVDDTGITARVGEALLAEAKPSFVLIQEGGSSGELYLHAHTTADEAEADRVSCGKEGAYRTSPIVEIPGHLASAPGFYEAVESILRAGEDLELISSNEPDGLHLRLVTADDREGTELVTADGKSTMTWSEEGDGETVLAEFRQIQDGVEIDSFEMDGDAWREFEQQVHWPQFVQDINSSSIEDVARSFVDSYENTYEHKACGTQWTDTHSCACDDECPKCGTSVSPVESKMITRLSDDSPAKLETA